MSDRISNDVFVNIFLQKHHWKEKELYLQPNYLTNIKYMKKDQARGGSCIFCNTLHYFLSKWKFLSLLGLAAYMCNFGFSTVQAQVRVGINGNVSVGSTKCQALVIVLSFLFLTKFIIHIV